MILANLAVRRPVATAMLFVALGLLGGISWFQLPVQLFPELIFPEIFVSLTLQGASPEQVERDLLMPTEEEVGKLEGVREIESFARADGGNVRVSYGPGTDMQYALLQLQGRINRLQGVYPEQARAIVRRFDLGDMSNSIMELHVLGDADLTWLREFAELKIRPELEAVDGVVNATVTGGRRSAVQIVVDPLLMQANGLTLSDVRNRLNRFNLRRAYVGEVLDGPKKLPVTLRSQFTSLEDVRRLPLKPESSLQLGQIASVSHGGQEQTDRHRVNARPAVGVRIQKDDQANLVEVSRGVERVIDRLNREFEEEGVVVGVSSSQADLMTEALATLKQAAAVGAVLGLVVLYLFLRNLQFVSVLLLAIPVSLLITFNLMYAWDLSVNILSLCGLALAVGMLTDNGIVVMESIFKHHERGKSPSQAARDGTAEVGRAVIASTATTVAVFLPVAFLESDAQDILRELAFSMTFPLLASLFVALTLVPSLAAQMLRRGIVQEPSRWGMIGKYRILLKACLRHRVRVALLVAITLAGTLGISFFFILQQQIRGEQTRFSVFVDLPDGATLDATDVAVRQVEEIIREIEEVDRFTTNVQEAQGSIQVILKPKSERVEGRSLDRIKEDLEDQAQNIQGGIVGFQPRPRAGRGGWGGRGTSQSRRSGGFSMPGSSVPSEQAVVRGYDFSTLRMIADDLVLRLEELEEIDENSVRSDAEQGAPELHIIPSPEAMFDRRLETAGLLAAIGDSRRDGFQTSAPFLMPDATEVPIEARTTEDPDDDGPGLDEFKRTPVLVPSGEFVSLQEVSRIRTDEGRSAILRLDQSRRVIVSYQFASEILDSQPRLDAARGLIEQTVQGLVLPQSYSVEIVEAEDETIYYWMMGVAAILIYMILASLFESFSSPLVILCTIPTAVIGSCWALMLTDTGLSQQEAPMALLGFVVLLGITVNNGIILIDAIGVLQTQGFRRVRAVLAASGSRVRPILMTSATTLLGVVPLALEFGGDYEIWPPFAITVLGGLSVSMFSTLLFVPVAYLGVDQARRWLNDIGWIGILLSGAASAGSIYAIHTRYESTFWTSLAALPVFLLWLNGAWAVVRIHRIRMSRREQSKEIQRIQIRNLTKIYGEQSRFRREWGRHRSRFDRGPDLERREVVRDSLVWKIPGVLLLGLFGVYLEDPLWLYIHALASWAAVYHFSQILSPMVLPDSGRTVRLKTLFDRYGLPLLFLVYIQAQLQLVSVTLASGGTLLGVRFAIVLVQRVSSGRVVVDSIGGRVGAVRRGIYRAACAMPLLGLPKTPFQALAGVDLEIERGMFGLLGPNGAGKTTLMRILCRVLEPSYGSVLVDGVNITGNGQTAGLIGYLPQHFGHYSHVTPFEFLEYRALLEGYREGKERRNRVMECLEQVNLRDRMNDPIQSLSGGMRQRVGIAQTLLAMPRIIVVDEPTAGLDPVERIRFRNLLARVSQERIVLFSTHIVEDISGSCNRLAVLNEGRILYKGSPQAMREAAQGRVWEATLSGEAFERVQGDLRLISHLRTPEGIRVRFLRQEPLSEFEAHPVLPTLEDAYLHLLSEDTRAC